MGLFRVYPGGHHALPPIIHLTGWDDGSNGSAETQVSIMVPRRTGKLSLRTCVAESTLEAISIRRQLLYIS
jgi:hypothetical protein